MDDNGNSLAEVPEYRLPDLKTMVANYWHLRRHIDERFSKGISATVSHKLPDIHVNQPDGTVKALPFERFVEEVLCEPMQHIGAAVKKIADVTNEQTRELHRLMELPDIMVRLAQDISALSGRLDEVSKRLDRMSAAAHAVISHGEQTSQVRIERTDGADGGGRPDFIEKG